MAQKREAAAKIAVVVADKRWRKGAATLPLLRRAARLALTKRNTKHTANGDAVLTILLADDPELHDMNKRFRQKDKPTNVLSFPSDADSYLGDIALSFSTVKSEARAQKKRFAHHAAHMALHGVLHLLGYDHQKKREADAMEKLETELLGEINIAPPYETPPLPRGAKGA